MHYFLIAGEASGDLHGASLIEAIKMTDPLARFTFLGGGRMAAAAAGEPLIHIRDMAYMGVSEVLRHLGDIRKNFSLTRLAIKDEKPDCVILIDYPSFNLKIARFAHKLGIPVYYYISPKIWAWKSWRVRDIRRLVDRMLCILPFEPEFYAERRYVADYVGNPSVEEVDKELAGMPSKKKFVETYNLPDKPLLALLPGSRIGEIRNNLSIMTEVLGRFPQYRGVIAGAPDVPDHIYRMYTELPIVRNDTLHLLAHSRAALVTSGTATLETALVGTPQVVLYRGNGRKITYNVMKRVLKIKYVSLPNLIAGCEVVPEMLMHFCTPALVGDRLAEILPERSAARAGQIDGYRLMRDRLGNLPAAYTAATIIAEALAEKNRPHVGNE